MEALEKLANVPPDEQRARARKLRDLREGLTVRRDKKRSEVLDRREKEIAEREALLRRREADVNAREEYLKGRVERVIEETVIKADGDPGVYSVRKIKAAVAWRFGVTQGELDSPQRLRAITHARHMAMWLCARHSTLSLTQIGQRFGGRDHTTVLNARRRMQALWDVGDADFLSDIRAIYLMMECG